MAGTMHHKVLIVGGGTAGITVAASLKRHGPGGIDIAIVEPSDTHYYQPAFTLVGAGVYDLARTRRTTESLVPSGVKRVKAAAHKFDPANNQVELSTGDGVTYDYLVVCPGVKLDWAKIDGLAETLGREGVCSNYSPDHVSRRCPSSVRARRRRSFISLPTICSAGVFEPTSISSISSMRR